MFDVKTGVHKLKNKVKNGSKDREMETQHSTGLWLN
jgi:hypothetical protein